MPHVNGSSGDDLASSDEVKVYKDEGDESKNKSESILREDKLNLVSETEDKPSSSERREDDSRRRVENGKALDISPHEGPPGFAYVVTPYPHPNGLGMGMHARHPHSPLFMYNNHDAFAQPPPAHMGIPPVAFDPKTGLARQMYIPPLAQGQYPGLYPDMPFPPMQWHTSSMYPVSSSFRSSYPGSLHVNTANLPRYSPPGILPSSPGMPPSHHHGIPHPAIVTPGPKQEIHPQDTHRNSLILNPDHHPCGQPNTSQHHHQGMPPNSQSTPSGAKADKKKTHIKKPLNAFMLYMKEMRAQVVAECTLKESAAINQILGRRWHALDNAEKAKYFAMARQERERHLQRTAAAQACAESAVPPQPWHALDRSEQAKYYELARKERQLHMQLYPGWSARDNYAQTQKKKKRKRDKVQGEGSDGENLKKCRARYGLDQQQQWCKPCQRKKKCIRYTGGDDSSEEGSSVKGEELGECSIKSDMLTSPDSQTADTDCCINVISSHHSETTDLGMTTTTTLATSTIANSSCSSQASVTDSLDTNVATPHCIEPHSSSQTSQEAMITSSTPTPAPPTSVAAT